MDGSTAHGIMTDQIMAVLGAQPVNCVDLPIDLGATDSQATCARVPGSMFGFFREAVHGRMYEYLWRKTVLVLHDWAAAGDVLRVDYVVDRGVFSVERERVDGRVYAVFLFQAQRTAAAAGGVR